MIEPASLPDSHHFEHEAMHTTFSLRLVAESRHAASGLARECSELLDSLEGKLSRFIDGSDVDRINHMQAGETLYLSEACHDCLLLATRMHVETGGLFDAALGARIEHLKAQHSSPPPPLEGQLVIHPDVPAVTCQSPGRQIDLGGIGKGFALDQLKNLLLEWETPGALLTSGASTILACGPHAWPVDLTIERDAHRITLRNRALSASGTGIQGSHIVDPSISHGHPHYRFRRVWVLAPAAAPADAWSTTLMLMPPEQAAEALANPENSLEAAFAQQNDTIQPL